MDPDLLRYHAQDVISMRKVQLGNPSLFNQLIVSITISSAEIEPSNVGKHIG